MGARWYAPELGRFTQPDTIIPNPRNSVDFDRYHYVRGNPIKYNDPSGRNPCYGIGDPATRETCMSAYRDSEVNGQLTRFGISAEGRTYAEKRAIVKAAEIDGQKWQTAGVGDSPEEAFQKTHGEIHIVVDPNADNQGNCEFIQGTLTCKTAPDIPTAIHEFGHAFDINFGREPSNTIPRTENQRSSEGLECSPHDDCLMNRLTLDVNLDDYEAVQEAMQEEFADFYLNWILDGVPGYDYFGLTDEPTKIYHPYTREMWWNWNILPLVH